MKRCVKCVMPETWAGIQFDEQGVCSICRQAEQKRQIDWAKRQEELARILEEHRAYAVSHRTKYDCLVGYSGGKDTAYTLWAAVVKYHMRPLAVTFDHSFPLSEEGEWNLTEIPKILNCDHLRFSLGKDLRNALCLRGSEVNGDFCWHCHNGIGAFPARISQQWNIPLQVWGEPSAEYQTFGAYKFSDVEEQNEKHFQDCFQSGVTPEMVLPEGMALDALLPMMWPRGTFPLKAIYLGNYEPWNQRQSVEIITRELGWKHRATEGTYVDWDKVDCPFEPVRDWQKFMKRGFGRTTFQASKDVREGRLTRDEALQLVEKHDGKRPAALDVFLREVGMSEHAFDEITRRHVVKGSTDQKKSRKP